MFTQLGSLKLNFRGQCVNRLLFSVIIELINFPNLLEISTEKLNIILHILSNTLILQTLSP